MSYCDVFRIYEKRLKELHDIVHETELAIVNESSNISIIGRNINFFVKSFLVLTCTHLEMYIKAIVLSLANDIENRLMLASIPASIIDWRCNNNKKSGNKDRSSNKEQINFTLSITEKEIDDLVSGNVYKTKDVFYLLGVDLSIDAPKWESWKDLIQTIVTKRNNIIHHNDSAIDISLGDIRENIAMIKEYMFFIAKTCEITKNKP